MPINLQEIRTAVQTYLDTKVTVSISALTPASGSQIGQNEEFCFLITVTNATTTLGGIALKNVRYYLRVDNTTVCKLIVPPAGTLFPLIARYGPFAVGPAIPVGSLVQEMYLFPSVDDNYLNPGETDTIGTTIFSATSIIKGRSQTPANGSITAIRFKVLAEVDMDYLFPKNEDSATATRTLLVQF